MNNMGIHILSTGKALPEKRLSNADLSEMVDTNDEWIVTRTGISERRICTEETCMSLALDAARDALNKSDINTEEIGLIITATSTGDYIFPSVACRLQKELALPETVISFDLSAACTGFIYALGVARSMMATMPIRYALVVAAEKMSKIVDYSDRSTCILFGDGAGAVLLESSDGRFLQKGYSRGNVDVLNCPGIGEADQTINMCGQEVFKFAVNALESGIEEILRESETDLKDVAAVICHQANERIIRHVQKRFKGYEDKFFINIKNYGNTSSASVAIALDEAMEEGKIKAGDKVILSGFGAGLSWSSIIMQI